MESLLISGTGRIPDPVVPDLRSFAFSSFEQSVHDLVELELKEEERWPHS